MDVLSISMVYLISFTLEILKCARESLGTIHLWHKQKIIYTSKYEMKNEYKIHAGLSELVVPLKIPTKPGCTSERKMDLIHIGTRGFEHSYLQRLQQKMQIYLYMWNQVVAGSISKISRSQFWKEKMILFTLKPWVLNTHTPKGYSRK